MCQIPKWDAIPNTNLKVSGEEPVGWLNLLTDSEKIRGFKSYVERKRILKQDFEKSFWFTMSQKRPGTCPSAQILSINSLPVYNLLIKHTEQSATRVLPTYPKQNFELGYPMLDWGSEGRLLPLHQGKLNWISGEFPCEQRQRCNQNYSKSLLNSACLCSLLDDKDYFIDYSLQLPIIRNFDIHII